MAVDLNMSVLIVDDQIALLEAQRILLKQLGFEDVDTATDGTEGLQKARGRQYGLIISDWTMEPMSGLEFLKEIRKDSDLQGTPFILVTAEDTSANIETARAAGVDGYIVKPVNAAILKKQIANVIGKF